MQAELNLDPAYPPSRQNIYLRVARPRALIVLKGACTIVTEPQGHTRINWRSNPLLATAGTGDVLAGMIAGLLAQGMQPFDAASAAVYLHTAAADLVAQKMDLGRTGLLASDLLSEIPIAMTHSEHAEI